MRVAADQYAVEHACSVMNALHGAALQAKDGSAYPANTASRTSRTAATTPPAAPRAIKPRGTVEVTCTSPASDMGRGLCHWIGSWPGANLVPHAGYWERSEDDT
jgi:hypothetical protein